MPNIEPLIASATQSPPSRNHQLLNFAVRNRPRSIALGRWTRGGGRFREAQWLSGPWDDALARRHRVPFPPAAGSVDRSVQAGCCATRHESAAKATGGSEVKGGRTAAPEPNSRPGGLIVRQAWMGVSESQGYSRWLGQDVAGYNRFWGRPPAVDAEGLH
jgi:hypothetical protein